MQRLLTGAAACALTLALAAAAAAAPPAGPPAEAASASVAPAASPAGAVAANVQLESREGYNTEYLFGLTRGVAYSTLTPALKPVVFLFTLPLDVALLPVAIIGGFFG